MKIWQIVTHELNKKYISKEKVKEFIEQQEILIENLYQKIERLDLEPEQRKALRAVRNLLIEEQALADHPVNTDQVLLSIAGILTEKQFHDFSGKAKEAREARRALLLPHTKGRS